MGLGEIVALSASLAWALGVNVYGDLSKKYSPAVINFNRAIVAFPLFLLAFLISTLLKDGTLESFFVVTGTDIFWLLMSCVASYALGDLLFFKSVDSPLQVTGALAIASTYPLWSALTGVIFFGQKLNVFSIVGLLIVVSGTIGVIIFSRKSEHARALSKRDQKSKRKLVLAALLAFCVSLFWSFNIFSINKVRHLDSFISNAYRLGFAILLCPLVAKIVLGSGKVKMSKKDFLATLPMFIFEGFGGSLCYVYGLSHTTLAVGAVLTSLSPVLSVPIYAFRHREKPEFRKTAAIVFVVIGLVLLVVFDGF